MPFLARRRHRRVGLRVQFDRRRIDTGRIAQLMSATTSSQPFSAAAGLGTSSSLSDYANSSVSWLQSQHQAGEQPTRLPELSGQPGDDGGVERDRRRPRHRNDQHADHRELLHDDGQIADDRQHDVLVVAQRCVNPMALDRLHILPGRDGAVEHDADAESAHAADRRGEQRPVRRPRSATRRPVRLRAVVAQPDQSAAVAHHRQQSHRHQSQDGAVGARFDTHRRPDRAPPR